MRISPLNPRARISFAAATARLATFAIPPKFLTICAKELGLSATKRTTDDLKFTVETVSCLGACGLAPVITVNGKSLFPDDKGKRQPKSLRTQGRINMLKNRQDLIALREGCMAAAQLQKRRILVCAGTAAYPAAH